MFGGSISLTTVPFYKSRLPDLFFRDVGRSSSRYCHSFFVPSLYYHMLVTGADVVLYNCLVAVCDRIGQWELAASLAISGCQAASLVRKS